MTSMRAQSAFMAILAVCVAAAAFRVATAPDRVRDRKDTARSVCLGAGGQWVKVDRDEICQKPELAGNKG
jgi:hypothetical protein